MTKKEILEWIDVAKYILIIAFFIWLFKDGCGHSNQNIGFRDKNGIDTIYTDDSAYIIHFEIDSSYEIEKEYDPPERN
jgi:hypothetical protein